MRVLLISLLIFLKTLCAQEVFSKEDIAKYFNQDNPFVYTALAQKSIYEQKENYEKGTFDTNLALKYEKKEYPLSDGEFISAGIEKPMENGMEFKLGYRKAEGIQEYNNIKTGDQGEAIFGVNIPVFSVASDISKRKLDLHSAKLDTKRIDYESKDNLRLLYFDALIAYYKLLYFKESLDVVKELLSNAEKREIIIIKKARAGSVAEISTLEAKQQIINRKQNLLSTQNSYKNALENFTMYLNLSPEVFLNRYSIASIIEVKNNYSPTISSVDEAISNRPDLIAYHYEKEKLKLQQSYTAISKYPKLDLGIYAVHDFEYENGFKVTLGMDFPLERRKYLSKNLELKERMINVDNQKEKKIMRIKTRLRSINNSIQTLEKNIDNASFEVDLVEKLEDAENKKYNIGLSNLFIVNQREIYTLSVKKKFIKYHLDYLMLQEELNKVVAKPIAGF